MDEDLFIEMHGEEKCAGQIRSKTYRTYITQRTDKTFFRMWQGFLISVDILKALQEKQIEDIIIEYIGREYFYIYRATLKQFLESELEYTYKEKDVQKCVKIVDMQLLEKRKI